MCHLYTRTHACGHDLSVWQYCKKAKRKELPVKNDSSDSDDSDQEQDQRQGSRKPGKYQQRRFRFRPPPGTDKTTRRFRCRLPSGTDITAQRFRFRSLIRSSSASSSASVSTKPREWADFPVPKKGPKRSKIRIPCNATVKLNKTDLSVPCPKPGCQFEAHGRSWGCCRCERRGREFVVNRQPQCRAQARKRECGHAVCEGCWEVELPPVPVYNELVQAWIVEE